MIMRKSALLVTLSLSTVLAVGQSRLALMPGAAQYTELRGKASQAAKITRGGGGRFIENGLRYAYQEDSKWKAVDFKTGKVEDLAEAPPTPERPSRPGGASPGRGRQASSVVTSDGKTTARYRDGNVFIQIEGGDESAVTTDGDLAKRIKFGTGSWVYGEELGQNAAMGFSPDGKHLWYYRFDESKVKDFYTLRRQITPQAALEIEAYPKPGTPNPEVDLYIYDVEKKTSSKVASRAGAFDDGLGHYLHAISWSPDSKELYFHRSNRIQNIREWCAATPSGAVRVVDTESWPAGWVEPGYYRRQVGDRWLIDSENSGNTNLYWVDPVAGKRTGITNHKFDVMTVLHVDEASKHIFYYACSGSNPYQWQVHRVGFDGKGDKRITDPKYHHTVEISPDGKGFIDTAENSTSAPEVRVLDSEGKVLKIIRKSDISAFNSQGFQSRELASFPSLDGKATLYMHIDKPKDFDRNKKYPVLISVYGGPLPSAWSAPRDSWGISEDTTNYGFICVDIYGRGGNGRGNEFRQAIYKKLGIVEIDDQAAGAKYLSTLPYVDASKIGIHGSSYGGYASVMCLLRYPELFAAAASSSMVSDWRNYDTTYTERYMGLYPENKDAYEAGSAMKYAADLKGWLMIYYGTADDNTHPVNALQMISSLQRAGKTFEVQVGPDAGHSGINGQRMMEFFIERMVLGK